MNHPDTLYASLTQGPAHSVVAEHFVRAEKAWPVALAEMRASREGYVQWVLDHGLMPLQIEEVALGGEPFYRHDHPILQACEDRWVLYLQERGRSGPVLRTYASRSDALRSLAEEGWQHLLDALHRLHPAVTQAAPDAAP